MFIAVGHRILRDVCVQSTAKKKYIVYRLHSMLYFLCVYFRIENSNE